MSNINQNNEIEIINKEISLLKDRLKINKESKNQFQNVLTRIAKIRIKQEQRTTLYETTKAQNILKDIFKNTINNIEKKDDLLRMHL